MNITLTDYAVAKAANDNRITRGIADSRRGVAFGYALLAALGIAFAGYTVMRLVAEVA